MYWPAALAFYLTYVGLIATYSVRRATTSRQAARHGAELGFVAYSTYELTNWAVIANWPPTLVPVDILWGVVLTAMAAVAGKWTALRLDGEG